MALNLEGDSAQVGLGEFGSLVEDRLRGCRDQPDPRAIGASSRGAKDPEHQPSPGVYPLHLRRSHGDDPGLLDPRGVRGEEAAV